MSIKEAVTAEILTSRRWRFYRQDGAIETEFFAFLHDGSIGGYESRFQRFWKIEDGVLALLDLERRVSARFDFVSRDGSLLHLKGSHLADPKIILGLAEQSVQWPRIPGTKSSLSKDIKKYRWEIGDHTYGTPTVIDGSTAKFKIGKFTSIADGVTISLANHRMDTVSTYPFVGLRRFWPSAPQHLSDHDAKGDLVIGNDVWIGSDVFIGSGVKIGDGAVIGAKTVVIRDVPPYAVVVGNPSRIIRFRFSPAIIEELLLLAWWDWPDDVIDSYLPLMISGDVEAFINKARMVSTSCGLKGSDLA